MSQLITLLYIEGACISEQEVSEFSRRSVMKHSGLTEEELLAARNNEFKDDATYITIKHHPATELTTVTVFNSDGEAVFYIGDTEAFTEHSIVD